MRILDCPECDWTTKPKHKRPKAALGLHRKAKHGTHPTIQAAVDSWDAEHHIGEGSSHGVTIYSPGATPGFLITLLDGTQHFVPAETHEETIDRHWFFRGGALKESFKRNTVTAVEVA